MVRLISSNTKNGYLVDIVLALEDESEINRYKTMLVGDKRLLTCPHCGEVIELHQDRMRIRVYSPLTSMRSMIGSDTGEPIIICDKCLNEMTPSITMDLSAFPSVSAYLNGLRRAYQAKQQKKGGRRGG